MATDRRAAFRQLIRRLDPAQTPKIALEQELYVEPAGSISERLASRLELEPTSTHMLVGGIGSGKTTQLLRVQQRLEEVGDVRAFFVDVLERQRAERLNKKGVLLALAGLAVSDAVATPMSAEVREAQQRVKSIAEGYWLEWFELDDGDPEPDGVWRAGIIEPPDEPWQLSRLVEAIRTLSDALAFRPVLLFDGLDRLADVAMFANLVSQDVQTLKHASIGAVVVAPQHARTWQQGMVQDAFDELHLHGAAQLVDDADLPFLESVLVTRAADTELLPKNICTRIAKLSGGLIRDLLALARSSAEEAYRLGADAVEESHVMAAADRFGRSLLIGIEQGMVDSLVALATARDGGRRSYKPVQFTVATDADAMLLLRRLVIEVPSIPVHYILHPTIVPLIAGIRRRA